jgi:condensin complex subunit 1
MDNPIFRKLQETIEHPCRSKEWFPLAEQALNTVYALGDHPDFLCDALIKNLTRRAFAPRKQGTPAPALDNEAMEEDPDPDATQGDIDPEASQASRAPRTTQGERSMGDAFELSQLLFVVGHVAIKHIAYLELVEREWKRQKDEKPARELLLTSSPVRNNGSSVHSRRESGRGKERLSWAVEGCRGARSGGWQRRGRHWRPYSSREGNRAAVRPRVASSCVRAHDRAYLRQSPKV